MNEHPGELAAAFAAARRALEPSAERLDAVHARVLAQAHAPVATRRGLWRGLRVVGLVVVGGVTLTVALEHGASDTPPRAQAPAPIVVANAPDVRAVEPPGAAPAPPVLEAGYTPSATVKVVRPPPRARPTRGSSASATPPARPDVLGPEFDAPESTNDSLGEWVVANAPREDPSAIGAQATDDARRGSPVRGDTPDSLLAEVRLIREARQALTGRALDVAAVALAEHARRFPAGQLQAERMALEVRLACARTDGAAARAKYAELKGLRPSRALLRSVEEACSAWLHTP